MASTIIANAVPPDAWWIDRVITHYEAHDTWIALWFAEDAIALFRVAEVIAGKWFEVFPLLIDTSLPDYLQDHAFKPVALAAPLAVARVASLWREEWQEAAPDSSQFLGAGPHGVQHAAPCGTAPATAHAVTVHAGIAFDSTGGDRLVICSSVNSPFLIDLATETADIDAILRFHTFR